jgi:hypothetical protein
MARMGFTEAEEVTGLTPAEQLAQQDIFDTGFQVRPLTPIPESPILEWPSLSQASSIQGPAPGQGPRRRRIGERFGNFMHPRRRTQGL